ncbi:hypothetical protein KIN20_010947 [Parelaphostrongylus tenuis]|uniref:Uncharacterized protein n=1 Tax=Parelaphostrongylus tenuis TaxID=148309 RepID=A0AAD5M8N5_PARTN|nr:hypothetical protein KIN20_010947 [Parelaphostrongylus tenuis]
MSRRSQQLFDYCSHRRRKSHGGEIVVVAEKANVTRQAAAACCPFGFLPILRKLQTDENLDVYAAYQH